MCLSWFLVVMLMLNVDDNEWQEDADVTLDADWTDIYKNKGVNNEK